MILYYNGATYDLTPLVVSNSITYTETIDKTFDRGGFTIESVKSNYFVGLDMSKPLPRYSRVRFELDGIIINALVQTDQVNRSLGQDRYAHNVELISVSKLLFETTSSQYTLTQPQGDLGLYYRTISKHDGDLEALFPTTYTPIDYTLKSQSLDTSLVDGLTLKQVRQYRVLVNVTAFNQNVLGDRSFQIRIKVGTTELGEYIVTVPKAGLSGGVQRSFDYSFIVENTSERSIAVEISGIGPSLGLRLFSSEVLIYTNDVNTMNKFTLDYIANKILNDDINEQMFYLDTNSEALLSKYISPEFTFSAVNKWTQLSRIADYIKAYVRSYYEDDTVSSRILVSFRLFEDLDEQINPYNIDIEQSLATIDDYTHAVELNAKNIVYKEGYKLEPPGYVFGTLRANSEQVTQITTNNIGIILDEPIEDVYQFEVIIGKSITNGVNTYSSSTVYDVTDLIVEKPLWDTLSDDATYTVGGRASLCKCNTLHYTKGDNKILGLEYTGTKPAKIIGTEIANRAIYEMVFAKITRETGLSVTTVDNGISDDANVRWRIKYKPLTKSNVRLYKDDQSGFQASPTRFLNEEMAINDALSLGDYAQGMVNRMGGTTKAFSGRTNGSLIPNVSTKYGDYLLVSRTIKRSGDLIDYNLNYIKDYVFVSSYEGYDLRERLYLIDNNNVVERVDKYLAQIIFDTSDSTVNPLGLYYGVKEFVNHVVKTRTPAIPPTTASITFYNSEGFKQIATTVMAKVVGRTIEWRVAMKNNYSAGLQKYELDGKVFQKDVIYTDIFGVVDSAIVNIYKNASSLATSEANQYPNVIMGDLKLLDYEYDVKKDAREVFINSIQFAYLSNDTNIIVYNFMAKSSDMVLNTLQTFKPKVAFLDYVPDVNSKQIDLTRAEVSPNEVINIEDTLNKGRLIVSSKYWAISPSYVEGLYSWQPIAELEEPYDQDVDYYEDLISPIDTGEKARVKYSLLDWMETSSHLGHFGYIKPTLAELPSGVKNKQAVVTGYELVETDETEWDLGFEPQWVSKVSLASPYDYDIDSTETLPTPLTLGLKARVRTLAWQSNAFQLAERGFIKPDISFFNALSSITNIGKKGTVQPFEALDATAGEYASAGFQLNITTDSSWNPNNVDDMWFQMQDQYLSHFQDMEDKYFSTVVLFSNGVTTKYWKFDVYDASTLVEYFTLNVTATAYYESESIEILQREELTVSTHTKDNIWFEMQSDLYALFSDIPSNDGAVFKVYDGLTYKYWKFQELTGEMVYYLYTYNNVLSYTYYISVVAPGPTYTNDLVDNAEDLVAWLNENHPAYLEDDGVVARGSDGTLPVNYFYAVVTSKGAKAIAIYDENTLELMLVDKREIVTHEIHYRGKKL